jgi:serine/threonine protein kinase
VEHTNTERSVLGYVRHPFIVGMNMAFQSKDKLYFVLDYCAGGELFFQLGKTGRFPEYRARFYAAEIILAIRYDFVKLCRTISQVSYHLFQLVSSRCFHVLNSSTLVATYIPLMLYIAI